MKKAKMALARKVSVILHCMLVDGTPFAADKAWLVDPSRLIPGANEQVSLFRRHHLGDMAQLKSAASGYTC